MKVEKQVVDKSTGRLYHVIKPDNYDTSKPITVIHYMRGDWDSNIPIEQQNLELQGLTKHVINNKCIIVGGKLIENFVLVSPYGDNSAKWGWNVAVQRDKDWIESNFKIATYIMAGYSAGGGAILNFFAQNLLTGRKPDLAIIFNGYFSPWNNTINNWDYPALLKFGVKLIVWGGKNDTNSVCGPSMLALDKYFKANLSLLIKSSIVEGDHGSVVDNPDYWNASLATVLKQEDYKPVEGDLPAVIETPLENHYGVNAFPWTYLRKGGSGMPNMFNEDMIGTLKYTKNTRIYVSGQHALDRSELPFGLDNPTKEDWNKEKKDYNKFYWRELANRIKEVSGNFPFFNITIAQSQIIDAYKAKGIIVSKNEVIPVLPDADKDKEASYATYAEAYRFVRNLPAGANIVIDNEWNKIWWKERGIQTPNQFSLEVIAVSKIILAENPDVNIIAGPISTGEVSYLEDVETLKQFIIACYNNNAGKLPFKGISFNYYGTDLEGISKAIKEVAYRYAGDCDVYCFENGADTNPKSRLTAGSEQGQADYLAKQYKTASKTGLKNRFTYALFDEDGTTEVNSSEQFRTMGIYGKKAYKNLISLVEVPPVVTEPEPEVNLNKEIIEILKAYKVKIDEQGDLIEQIIKKLV